MCIIPAIVILRTYLDSFETNANSLTVFCGQVRDIHLSAEMFSVENNLLTPTFKLKRAEARAKFQQALETMYEELE